MLIDELDDKIADTREQLEDKVFAKDLPGITDIEVGPDGNLYVLPIYGMKVIKICKAVVSLRQLNM